MRQQDIEVRARIEASPTAVYRLLDDSTTWPRWTPIESCELVRAAGADGLGEVRVFRTGRVRVREEIVEREADTRLAYVLLAGLAVRDYRAQIDLSSADGGCDVRWHTTFRAKVPGLGWVYRRALDRATRQFVEGLARHVPTIADR